MKKPFKLIITRNDKQIEYVGSYTSEVKANVAFKKIVDKNKKNIIFPVRFLNSNEIKECRYEYLLLKLKTDKDDNVTKLRNEYGEFVDHVITNDDEWIIYDKAPYDREETFWVYGYHPRIQRKDFMFIFNELLKPKATDKYQFCRVVVFKNKLLIDSAGNLDMVTCKNESDCIRLYNQLEDWSRKHKFRYCLFSGSGINDRRCGRNDDLKQYWLDRIKELTSWSNLKILRSNTRP